MFRPRPSMISLSVCLCQFATLFCSDGAVAGDLAPFTGEVTVEELNLRSGPSTNYYVVARLRAGDRVTVVGEESGWYAVQAPPGCYSLISTDYVDLDAGGKTGVVAGDNVRVRAGSDIERKKYAVQLKLDKGAQVRILGDDGEGFYTIVPPDEARFWVHSQYIARASETALGRKPEQRTADKPTAAPKKTNLPANRDLAPQQKRNPPELTAASRVPHTNAKRSTKRSSLPSFGEMQATLKRDQARHTNRATRSAWQSASGDEAAAAGQTTDGGDTVSDERETDEEKLAAHRDALLQLEEQLKAEIGKPGTQRKLDSILEGYQALAAQEDNPYVQAYARRRLDQVQYMVESLQALRRVRSLSERISSIRRQAMDGRTSLREFPGAIKKGFDAKGELRESMIYASPIGPRRYRLIDPDLEVPRTLCYVEILPDSQIDVAEYLGRVVGIRAQDRYIQTGDVDPIEVLVVDEIVALSEPAPTEASGSIPLSAPASADIPTATNDRQVIRTDGGDEVELITLVDTSDNPQ